MIKTVNSATFENLKSLLKEKKLVPNCSYNPSDFYFCIGISGESEQKDIPESFKQCKGCKLGKFLHDLCFVTEGNKHE